MIVDLVCTHCGQPFQAHDWKEQRYCSKSCGAHASKNKRHGLTDTIEHRAWARIRRRCYSPNYHNYHYYGGRGIRVCERWDSFENFLADMGPRPGKGYSIERINNDGDYGPDNCKWATALEQSRNRRGVSRPEEDEKIRKGVADGLNFVQIAEQIGKSHSSVTARAYRLGLRSGQPCSNFYGRTTRSLSSQNGASHAD